MRPPWKEPPPPLPPVNPGNLRDGVEEGVPVRTDNADWWSERAGEPSKSREWGSAHP